MRKSTIIDLDSGYDSSEKALSRLKLELRTLKRLGVRQIKILHGREGAKANEPSIRDVSRNYLKELDAEGSIALYCYGESFGPFEKEGLSIARACPAFRNDPDWSRRNDAVTMVFI